MERAPHQNRLTEIITKIKVFLSIEEISKKFFQVLTIISVIFTITWWGRIMKSDLEKVLENICSSPPVDLDATEECRFCSSCKNLIQI